MKRPIDKQQLFFNLTPEVVLQGVEQAGFVLTGEYIQLNSYENRVFDLMLEPEKNPEELLNRVIAKYYRPLRWSREEILEEHLFEEELRANGIPVIAPLVQKNGQTLSSYHGLFLALFPKCFGRMPQELSLPELKSVGRLLARIHNIGEQSDFKKRPDLSVEEFGWPALERIEEWVAPEVKHRYLEAAENILQFLEDHLNPSQFIRIHGDCHKGNLLQKDEKSGHKEFFFVDFDDCLNGPVAQDFWMLFSGDREYEAREHSAILEGYEELRHFPEEQLALFSPLRGLRIIHYAGWIAKRWDDPTFPQLFPQFQEYTYWAEEVEALEKIAWQL